MAGQGDHSGAGMTPPRRRSSERALRLITDATASVAGDRFLSLVVAGCATALGAAYAFITETTNDATVNRVVTFWDDGTVRTDMSYPVDGTPAHEIQRSGEVVMYRRNVAARFPRLPWLSKREIESFVGVPLHATNGELIGQLGVLSRHSDMNVHTTEEVLRGIAPRVAGELERARAIRALRQREQVLTMVVEHANDVLFRLETRPGPRLTYISPAVQQLSGYPSDAFMRSRSLFFRVVDRANRSSVARGLVREHRDRMSARWVRSDDSTLWVEYSNAATLDDAGRVVAIDGVIRDCTEQVVLEGELRAAERRERDVITALPDLVFRLGADGSYREYFDSEHKRPLVPPEAFLGRHIGEVMPEEIAVQSMRAIRAAIETGTMQRIEYPLQIDGDERNFEARIVPINEDEVLAFVRDFTAERRLADEDKRRVARDELENQVELQMEAGSQYGLTFREMTVLHHISRGLADKEIAEALGISAYTVNKHVASILAKMQAASRTAAGVRAVREGLLS